jgi:hypothetical protein
MSKWYVKLHRQKAEVKFIMNKASETDPEDLMPEGFEITYAWKPKAETYAVIDQR